jgi:glutathione S-transferase
MKLYDCGMAPNPRRARIFIAEKGLDIPSIEVSIIDGENLKDDYLAINPWGTLPALELDDGTVITEAPCIFVYLESLYPEPNLLGMDPIEIATVGSWERFCEMQGMQAIGEFFRNQNEIFKNRAMPGFSGISTIPDLVGRGKARAEWFFKKLEKQLGKSEFLAIDRFTAADITALCALDFAKRVGLELPPESKNIERWHKVVSTRPSSQL